MLDVEMVKGAKNVIFGGEGLFMTTLKGPGMVWLQGMPPDRMVSEIVRRLPSGGGLGLGIPIMMGGGGSNDAAEGTTPSAPIDGVDGGDGEAVAATDAAVDADRQATVASSGTNATADPDSPSALFGDAAPPEESPPSTGSVTEDAPLQDENPFGQGEETFQQDEPAFADDPQFDDGFGEESFSTDDSFSNDGFEEDTSFSTLDEPSAASSEEASEGASSILSTLWDLITGRDD